MIPLNEHSVSFYHYIISIFSLHIFLADKYLWMLGDLTMLKAPSKRSQREILHGLIRAPCSDCHSLFGNVCSCADQWKTLQYQHEIIIMIMSYQNVRIFLLLFIFLQTPRVVQDVHVITQKQL